MRARKRHTALRDDFSRDDSGQSLVELALLLPALILVMFATFFLVDIVHAQLKNHETARYAAFAMAHNAMRDYKQNPGIPPNIPIIGTLSGRAGVAQREVLEQTNRAYGRRASVDRSILGNVNLSRVNLSFGATNYYPTESVGQVMSWLGAESGGLGSVIQSIVGDVLNTIFNGALHLLGYNGAPLVTASAETRIDNAIFPSRYTGTDGRDARPFTGLTLRDSVSLIADPWQLADGRDVWTGGYLDDQTTEAAMHAQVTRMYFFQGVITGGAGGEVSEFMELFSSLAGSLGAVAGWFLSDDPYGNVLAARVASLNYHDHIESGRLNPYTNVGVEPRGGGAQVPDFDTIGFRDDAFNDRHSEMIKMFERRGRFGMGCKQAQTPRCDYGGQ